MTVDLGKLKAIVALYLGAGDVGVEAVSVECFGEETLVPHLPAALWDKLLSNLAKSSDEQVSLFRSFEELVNETAAQPARANQVTLLGTPLVEKRRDKPSATVTIELRGGYEMERLGATTRFRPFFKAQNPAIAESALWSVWDWTVQAVPFPDYAAMLANLQSQCDYYRRTGLPGVRDIGKAVFYAAMKGSSDRLAAEIGGGAGLTLEEFRALPDNEQGRLIAEHSKASLDIPTVADDLPTPADQHADDGRRECLHCGAFSSDSATHCYWCHQRF